MQWFTTVISRIFDPFFMLGVVFVVLLWGHPLLVPALIAMVFFPFFLYFLAWKMNIISDWDMSNRRQRPRVLWTLLAIEIISLFVFQLWPLLPILLAMIGFSVITHVWKISGHAMSAALATGSIILRFGWNYWPVLFIVPLVAWSRVIRKNHTVAQVVAGALYSWGVLALIYWR